MNNDRWTPEKIFVYRHPVDMRKQIDGPATIVPTQLGRDPADRSLYLFCNKGRDKLKMLIWHINGYSTHLLPEYGGVDGDHGTADAEKDFETLTGGEYKAGDGKKSEQLIGQNGISIRWTDDGARIDIPANGKKPQETLHYHD